MKINRSTPRAHFSALTIALGAAMGLGVLLASCVSQRASPPQRMVAPQVQPIRAAPPPPASREPADWRDRPLTPGNWTYRTVASGSMAGFVDATGGRLVTMACAAGQITVSIERRAGTVPLVPGGPLPVALVTTAGSHRFMATAMSDSSLALSLRGRDPTLDDLAFSRGRFAIEASGQPTLILPAWEEVGRVIEDCR